MSAQNFNGYFWDKVAFPVLNIQDSSSIAQFAKDYLIPLDSTVYQISLIDLNFDGPGLKDILIVYPSYDIYFLEEIPQKLARNMRKWPSLMNRSIVFSDLSVISQIESTRVDYLPILKGLSQSINNKYGKTPLKLFYRQNNIGIQFEIIKFDSTNKKMWEPDQRKN
jgi:hypothetical protein